MNRERPPALTRRTLLHGSLGLVSATLVNALPSPARAAAEAGDPIRQRQLRARLDTLLAGDGDPSRAVPGAALAVLRDGKVLVAAAAGHARLGDPDGHGALALTPYTPVRVASISKLATALTAARVAEQGLLDLDADLSGWLEFRLRNPAWPQAPITARQLLAHTGSLRDPPVYWMPAPGSIAGLLSAEAFTPARPGTVFEYCNLAYGLVATALENATGERFDRLAQRLALAPLGLEDCGFNWSGVPAARREAGGTLYRRDEAGCWQPQVDAAATLLGGSEPVILAEPGFELPTYRPGRNGTLFSPQGGLRAGVLDIARLAQAFARGGPGEALASPVGPSRWPEASTADIWGTGPQLLPARAYGSGEGPDLIGHAGQALGFFGGAWTTTDGRDAISYFVTGHDPQAELAAHPATGLTHWESTLLAIAVEIRRAAG
ncbi:MAG: beta-lactamase family protein [Gammaproteobacteria bacterium]|nr:beta-lactamase family protein [Gammaproteobacteria bacterium]TVQ47197.1 MAG: class A beta-lactamase-related serine hydrolase [Gammaproteobacteria bacterium]